MIMDSNPGKFFFTLSSYNQYRRNSIRRVQSSSSDSWSGSPPPTSKSEKKKTPIKLAWFQIFSSSKTPPLQSISSLSSPPLQSSPPIFYSFSEISNIIRYWEYNPSAPSWRGTLRNKQVMVFRRKSQDTELPKSKLSIIFQSHHESLVKLRGISVGHDHVYIIYDHSHGISLEDYLHHPDLELPYSSNWVSKMQIALDVANGLDYIHRHCGLIHHKINSSNVIVTPGGAGSCCNAKISLFGAAYVAATNNKRDFSKESDVFDFGVMIRNLFRVGDSFPEDVAEKLKQVALECMEPELDKRPEMVDVAAEISKLHSHSKEEPGRPD